MTYLNGNDICPIAFFSRTMAPAELNYEIYDKELLAIYVAFRQWRCYLEGARHTVHVVTDYKNLEHFNTTQMLSRRQVQWSQFLSSFYYEIFYRPGRLGAKPDALTRHPKVYPKGGDGAFALANPRTCNKCSRRGSSSLGTIHVIFPNVPENLANLGFAPQVLGKSTPSFIHY